MKKIIKYLECVFPFESNIKNLLLYLSLSPICNTILTNIYYYNCGGYIGGIYDAISIINPFNSCNYLCYFLSSMITINLYIKSYIFYIGIMFFVSVFFE
jgi:hypothetical protein